MKIRKISIASVVFVVALAMMQMVAFGTPIDSMNDRPVTVNSSGSNGEPTLQSLLNILYPGQVNVNTDQSPFGMWGSSSGSGQNIAPNLEFTYAGNATSNIIGIWSGTDTSNIVPVNVFIGAPAGTVASLTWHADGSLEIFPGNSASVPYINATTVNGIDPSRFGFFLASTATSNTFYSVDDLNSDEAHVLAFNATGNDWVLAFEDLPFGSADQDYNDEVLKVESIRGAG
ncbi:MAG: DUF4114 domain-containing protein, partial [Deltaproteobacteria bacterium]|nr:DUF4114 domain-containing protein [Deltaproteobacteria bacterium]